MRVMTKRKLISVISILLNALLIFVLVAKVKRPVVQDLSENGVSDSVQSGNFQATPKVIGEQVENSDLVKVVKVVDGDTIVLDSGKTLRYIGIDTPEVSQGKECFADEATARNKELVLGKEVRLEKDVSETDRYGRLLRYVYVDPHSQDTTVRQGIFVNENLVYEGYATAATYPPDVAYSDLFRQAEKDAREKNRGLWSKCANDSSENAGQSGSREADITKPVVTVIQSAGTWECGKNTYNCTDFKTQAEAQSAFEACGGTANDVHKLDRDGDGQVCETLP